MSFARRSSPAAVLLVMASVASFANVASCGAPSIEDDLGGGRGLPGRAPLDASAEGGAAASDDASTASVDASTDAADASVVTQTQLCSEGDLLLCFGFEGVVKDGSPNALVPAVSGVSFVPGKLGQAASFGVASAMRFDPSPALEVTTASVEAWVQMAPNPPGDGVIFDDDNRFSLTIGADGTVLCKPVAIVSTGKVVAGVWTHVACTFDGAKAHVYLDGVEQSSGAAVIGSSPASGAAVGGNAPSGEPFVGAIDSLRVFRVARTPAQIAAAAGK